ncbi:MAG: tRNA (adenosine(37)-N6)-dimethylallyltransferase MiaA [Coriobacteriia bacterium]
MHAASIVGIVGPTAVGKSAVAESVARVRGAEIISADSMQVYRGMDIGTAKTPPHRRDVPHHGIDLVDPGTLYSAALFQRDARAVIDVLRQRGVPALLVGGTGLYVRAALDDMQFAAGESASPVRADLEMRAAKEGPQALYDELRRLDPASADLVHPNNTRRVIRALEMLSEGVSYAEQTAGFSRRTFHYPDTRLVGLTLERSELYARVDARVDEMIAMGLLDEVAHLLELGFTEALTAAQAIGYKELVPVVRQGADLAAAIEDIKRSTRRYAKRQLTWFRADPRINWVDVTGLSATAVSERVLDLVESSGNST